MPQSAAASVAGGGEIAPGTDRRYGLSTGHVSVAMSTGWSWLNLVNISATEGVLTSLAVVGGDKYHYARIDIDGTRVVDDKPLYASNATTTSNDCIVLGLPFGQSMSVDVREPSWRGPLATYWVCWTTAHTEPVGDAKRYTDKADGLEFVRAVQEFQSADAPGYTVDALLGPRRWSRVTVGSDFLLGDEPLVGRVEAWDVLEQSPVPLGSVRMLIRPMGFDRIVDEFVLDAGDEPTAEFEVAGAAHLHGRFEVVADIDGTANQPAWFFRQ